MSAFGASQDIFNQCDKNGFYLTSTNFRSLNDTFDASNQNLGLESDPDNIFHPQKHRLHKDFDLPITTHSKKHANKQHLQYQTANLVNNELVSDNSSLNSTDHRDLCFERPQIYTRGLGFVMDGTSAFYSKFYNVNSDGTSRDGPAPPNPKEARAQILAQYEKMLFQAAKLGEEPNTLDQALKLKNEAERFLLTSDPELYQSIFGKASPKVPIASEKDRAGNHPVNNKIGNERHEEEKYPIDERLEAMLKRDEERALKEKEERMKEMHVTIPSYMTAEQRAKILQFRLQGDISVLGPEERQFLNNVFEGIELGDMLIPPEELEEVFDLIDKSQRIKQEREENMRPTRGSALADAISKIPSTADNIGRAIGDSVSSALEKYFSEDARIIVDEENLYPREVSPEEKYPIDEESPISSPEVSPEVSPSVVNRVASMRERELSVEELSDLNDFKSKSLEPVIKKLSDGGLFLREDEIKVAELAQNRLFRSGQKNKNALILALHLEAQVNGNFVTTFNAKVIQKMKKAEVEQLYRTMGIFETMNADISVFEEDALRVLSKTDDDVVLSVLSDLYGKGLSSPDIVKEINKNPSILTKKVAKKQKIDPIL